MKERDNLEFTQINKEHKENILRVLEKPLKTRKLFMKLLSFRNPTANDARALSLLMKQLGYAIEPDKMHKNILTYFTLENHKAWVAELHGEIVGCIAVNITKCFHREGSFLRIIAMIVSREKRQMGIGRELMQIAERYARERGCSHVELTSGAHREILGAHKFYKSLGYVELSSKKKYFGKKLN